MQDGLILLTNPGQDIGFTCEIAAKEWCFSVGRILFASPASEDFLKEVGRYQYVVKVKYDNGTHSCLLLHAIVHARGR